MKLFVNETEITSKILAIEKPRRTLNGIGGGMIRMRDWGGGDLDTYQGNMFDKVEIRHNTKSPFGYYKQFTVEMGNSSRDQNNVIVEVSVDNSSDTHVYPDSIALRESPYEIEGTHEIEHQVYNKEVDCWCDWTMSSDYEGGGSGNEDWDNPVYDNADVSQWTISEAGNSNVWLLPRFLGYKKVVEFLDDAANAASISDDLTDNGGSAQASGTVFVIMAAAQADAVFDVQLIEGGNVRAAFGFNSDGKFFTEDNGGVQTTTVSYSANTMYILKCVFDCATDKYSVYYWNDHAWATIREDEDFIAVADEIDEIKLITAAAGTDTFYCTAVDYSWSSGYTTDRILFLTKFDIAFIDDFTTSETKTYRVFYDDAAEKKPEYYLDIPYTAMTATDADPVVITTDEATISTHRTYDEYFQADFTDINSVDWTITANQAWRIVPAFSAATVAGKGVCDYGGPIFHECIAAVGANEYVIMRTYKNGIQKIWAMDDATWRFLHYHDNGTGGNFVDKTYYEDGGWQTVNKGAGVADNYETVGGRTVMVDDTNDKATSWFCFWDTTQSGADDIRISLNTNDDVFYMMIGYWAGAPQLAANAEYVAYNGILSVSDGTSEASKQNKADDLYNLYIGSDLTISSLGAETENTILNYRLGIGSLVRAEYSNNESKLQFQDFIEELKRKEVEYVSIQNHKTTVIEAIAGGVLTCCCDWDGDSAHDDPTKWETDIGWTADEFTGYGLIVTDQTKDTYGYAFSDSVTLVNGKWLDSDHTKTHADDTWYCGAEDEPLTSDINFYFELTSAVPFADIEEITIDCRYQTWDDDTPDVIKMEIYNFTDMDWDTYYTLIRNGSESISLKVSDMTDYSGTIHEYLNVANDMIRIRFHYDMAAGKSAWVKVFWLRVLSEAGTFVARQYYISDNTATLLTCLVEEGGAAADFAGDGVSSGQPGVGNELDGDGCLIVPKNEVIINTLLSYAPDLRVDRVDTLANYSMIEAVGQTPYNIIMRIISGEDAKFFMDLERYLCVKTSYTASGFTFDSSNIIGEPRIVYSPEDLCNRCRVYGRELNTGNRIEGDWQEDATSIATYGVFQKIITREDIRSVAEANAWAVAYVAKNKDLKFAATITVLADDYIEKDILGMTCTLTIDNINESDVLIEGITLEQGLGKDAPLLMHLRLGDQPANLDNWEKLGNTLASIKRNIRNNETARLIY